MADSQRTTKPVAVVTGGSQGLGLALVEALARDGWALVFDARRADRLDAAVARIAPLTDVRGVAGDVTDAAHRDALARAAAELGPVQLLVNNASTLGVSPLPSLRDIDVETLRRVFDVNVVAPIALVQAFDHQLADGATVVNVTSDAAVEPYEGWGGYGASKAALEHASAILAKERPDLRVLVVDPGDMRTEMHQDAFPGEDISDRPKPEASVPGLLTLIHGEQPSGRYQAAALVPAEASRS
ncbi:MAG TPA: SDR family oxidoreductase [Acidimicrobiia bacterium]|jgi:NAD(P)-dependent dehydrogenase (short-subunit alcohol dehydrogenase family)|nr:SDR family oxidoreductase [Acidimicrobiia bacterium]